MIKMCVSEKIRRKTLAAQDVFDGRWRNKFACETLEINLHKKIINTAGLVIQLISVIPVLWTEWMGGYGTSILTPMAFAQANRFA